LFFKKLHPAFHYIFFVIANEVKQFVEPFSNRNNKKGCRYNRGYGIQHKNKFCHQLKDDKIIIIIITRIKEHTLCHFYEMAKEQKRGSP